VAVLLLFPDAQYAITILVTSGPIIFAALSLLISATGNRMAPGI